MAEHPLTTLRKMDPEFMEKMGELDCLVFSEGALPKKVKYLIAMAFDAAHGAQGGVQALTQMAKNEGATREEIAEALRVAYHLSGVGSLYTASIALGALAAG